jgi:DNA-binding NarL/FixJ family response regulator
MHKTKIVIIDESEIFKIGLIQQLSKEAEFKLLDCHPDGDIFQFIEENFIEVVLLDLDSDHVYGLKQGKAIARHFPATKVVLLSSTLRDDVLFEGLKSGAAAYVEKTASVQKMANTIRKVSQGQYPINDKVLASSVVANRVIMHFQELASTGLLNTKTAIPLTNRERQILSFVANGNTNRDVADKLGLSEQTIKNHISSILRKLNANDRAHAVAIAIQNQWVAV